MKKHLLFLLLIFSINMSNSQQLNNNFNKKWLVYNTISNSINGWNSFSDSYILDFSNPKTLKIKTLGEEKVEEVNYNFNSDSGVVYEENGDVLYVIKELKTERLVLQMGETSDYNVFLTPLEDNKNDTNFHFALNLLMMENWISGSCNILLTNEDYKVADEIETNYKILIESCNSSKEIFKGAWLLDIYDNILLIELYSSNLDNKIIYIVNELNQKKIKATGYNRKGQFLVLEMYR